MGAASKTRGNVSFSLSEDWLATIIGLLIVLIIGAGLLGPGARSISVSADAGETASTSAPLLSGWHVSATIDGEPASVTGAATAFKQGTQAVITCRSGQLETQTRDLTAEGATMPDDYAEVVIVNECDAPVGVTYRINRAIPYPVFNLFTR